MFTADATTLRQIVLQIRQISDAGPEQHRTAVTTNKAIDWLAAEGYDPMFGARPVKRTLQRYLVSELEGSGRPGGPQQHDHRRRRRELVSKAVIGVAATARPARAIHRLIS